MTRENNMVSIGADTSAFNRAVEAMRKRYEEGMKALEGMTGKSADIARKSLEEGFKKGLADGVRKGTEDGSGTINRFTKNAKKDVGDIGTSLSTSFSTAFDKIRDKWKVVAGSIAAAAGSLKIIKDVAVETTNVSREMTRVFTRLESAFPEGVFDPKRFNDFANNARQAFGISKSMLGDIFSQFGDMDMNGAEQMSRLTLGIMSATKKSANESVGIVKQALAGQLEGLRAVGIFLQSTGDKAKDQQNAVVALTERYGDLIKTITSPEDRISGVWERFFEMLGEKTQGNLDALIVRFANMTESLMNNRRFIDLVAYGINIIAYALHGVLNIAEFLFYRVEGMLRVVWNLLTGMVNLIMGTIAGIGLLVTTTTDFIGLTDGSASKYLEEATQVLGNLFINDMRGVLEGLTQTFGFIRDYNKKGYGFKFDLMGSSIFENPKYDKSEEARQRFGSINLEGVPFPTLNQPNSTANPRAANSPTPSTNSPSQNQTYNNPNDLAYNYTNWLAENYPDWFAYIYPKRYATDNPKAYAYNDIAQLLSNNPNLGSYNDRNLLGMHLQAINTLRKSVYKTPTQPQPTETTPTTTLVAPPPEKARELRQQVFTRVQIYSRNQGLAFGRGL